MKSGMGKRARLEFEKSTDVVQGRDEERDRSSWH
jgi:hypothetical protein